MFFVLAQATPELTKLTNEVQQVASLGWTVVVLQVVTIIAGVIMKRDELRFSNRFDRLDAKCEGLGREVEDCNKDRAELRQEVVTLRRRFDADFHKRNPDEPVAQNKSPTDTIRGG